MLLETSTGPLAGRWAMAMTCVPWMGTTPRTNVSRLFLSNLNLGFGGPEPLTGLVRWAEVVRVVDMASKWAHCIAFAPLAMSKSNDGSLKSTPC